MELKKQNKTIKAFKMVMTRSMYKKMNECVKYYHPALANVPSVKYVIIFKDGLEGYQSFEDAIGDYAYQYYKHNHAVLAEAVRKEYLVAGGHF